MSREKLLKTEICHLFNTSKEFLRHYENKSLLHPEVNDQSYRLYGYEDVHKIREIILLRELDFSVKEMQNINNKGISKPDFLQLLKEHQRGLTKKITNLMTTQNDIIQLLELLETNETLSFLEKNFDERHFILTETLEGDEYLSLKTYYDKYKVFIENKSYSERTFQMMYNYNELSSGQRIKGKVAVEIDAKHSANYMCDSGVYLSVFFPFEHGQFKDLKLISCSIEAYLNEHHLKRVSDTVLEIEHPELSMFIDENTTIFELQIRVERSK